VLGWVDVWGWDKVVWCMVGLLGAGCGGMGRGCVGVGRMRSVLESSVGVVVLSIGKSGLNRVVWWISCGIGLSSTWIREVGWYMKWECCWWSRLLKFEKGMVWVKPNSFEEGTNALKVTQWPTRGWGTQVRRKVG